jgi:LacI family transcriptional regulator
VAELAGVSMATVSRVVNSNGYVAAETRRVVERVVRDHGYSANRSARGLSAGRSGLIGVTLPMIHPAFFSVIVGGLADAVYEQDMRIVFCPTLHEHDKQVSLLERLTHGTIDCALLVLPEESSSELLRVMEHGLRFVVIDPRRRLDRRVPTVAAAHFSGAEQMMRHLIGLGHRRIAAITGPAGWIATDERLRAYHAALDAVGVRADPRLVIESDFELDGGRTAGTQLLDLAEPPTAVFAFNDSMAIGVVQACLARGLRVPRDLSVAGFDDTDEALLVTPALTTVHQPLAEMGRAAFSLVTRLLENGAVHAARVELDTLLVVRDSTASPTLSA